LFVIGSGSTLTFKGKAVSPQEVARLLGVRYVLEGSVRRASGRVRIAVKLVDAEDGAQIWGDRFDDVVEDVFALQDKVALSVAGVIEPAITEAEARRASRRAPENMSSYDLYLMGYAAFQTFRKDETERALGLFERAIELDPKYAAALAMAAECHAMFVIYGWTGEPEKHRRLGLELAERALVLAGSDDWVLALTGNVLVMFDANRDRSTGLIDRAIALNPGSAYNWLASAALRLAKGDDEDIVIDHAERAMRLDPLSPINRDARMQVGVARFRQGRFAEALSALNEASSPHPYAYAHLAAALGHLGQVEAAREALARYRASADLSIDEAAALWLPPEHRKLFLDGIALAEGTGPAEGQASG
jgi:adenylate cyclase